MPIFFFDIVAVPTSAAPNTENIANASVITFVIADSIEAAETIARSAIIDYGWEIKAVSISRPTTVDEIAHLETDIQAIYHRASLHKVGLLFVAVLKVEGHSSDPVQIRSLGSPVIDITKRH